MSELLQAIQKGRTNRPRGLLMAGGTGAGKSTFAAWGNAPIFLCTEDGADDIGVDRILCHTLGDVQKYLLDLYDSDHAYRTVVIDSMTALEKMIHDELAVKYSDSERGYGKVYDYAVNEFRSILAALDMLRRERGMTPVMIAHTTPKDVTLPTMEPFTSWLLALHQKSADAIVQWCDECFFATKPITVKAPDKTGKSSKTAMGGNTRICHTVSNAGWMWAKNRLGMVPKFGLRDAPDAWAEYQDAIEAAQQRVRA